MQFVFKLQIYFLISDHDLKYFAIICGVISAYLSINSVSQLNMKQSRLIMSSKHDFFSLPNIIWVHFKKLFDKEKRLKFVFIYNSFKQQIMSICYMPRHFWDSGGWARNKKNLIVCMDLTFYYMYEYVCAGRKDNKQKLKSKV